MRIVSPARMRPWLILGICLLVFPMLGASPVKGPAAGKDSVESHIATFEDLDFNVFTNQKWGELSRSHAHDILVHWPDGHTTKGIEKHIEDLKGMFVPMPDLKITEHPIKIANGSWTAVVGRMTGTFSKPMPIGNGKTIPPTNKKLDLTMATIGHWTSAGVMDHEWLFWDNATYMKQLGLSK